MQQFAAREIGARIGLARKEAGGMTQEQLAELLDVSARSVQDYEAGITIPWKHFQRLEVIFKRPMGWFLHGDVDGEPADVRRLLEELTASVAGLAESQDLILERLEKIERERGHARSTGQRGAPAAQAPDR